MLVNNILFRLKFIQRVHQIPQLMNTILHLRCYCCTVGDNLESLCQYLNVNETQVKLLINKYPVIKKLDNDRLENLKQTMCDLRFPFDVLVKQPQLFNIAPIKIKYRYSLLQECGINDISPNNIILFFKVFRRLTIGQLKEVGMLSPALDIHKQLTSSMTWPTSCNPDHVTRDVNQFTLYSLRIEIIKNFLKANLHLNEEELKKGLQTNIRFQPLQSINQMLLLLQRELTMPIDTIKSNLFLLCGKPNNIRLIIQNIPCIGNIDTRKFLVNNPILIMKSYSDILEIMNILREHGIKPATLTSCPRLLSLSSATVRHRFEETKKIPEFQMYLNDPRFLKLILYYNKAHKRIQEFHDNGKKCVSLSYLTTKDSDYEAFKNSPSDKLTQGKDLLFFLNQAFGEKRSSGIYNMLKKDSVSMRVPVLQIKLVYDELSKHFTNQDIYENSDILLYPWNSIQAAINLLNETSKFNKNVDKETKTKSNKLTLVLNILKNNNNFCEDAVLPDLAQMQ